MVNKEFGEAAVEVLEVLKYVASEDVNKIPANFIEFLEENKSLEYICEWDHSKKIKDIVLKPKTEALLGYIYLNYWADDIGRKEFEQKLKENEELIRNELTQGFNDDIFKKQDNQEIVEQVNNESLPQTYKKNGFVIKLFNILKNIFRIR